MKNEIVQRYYRDLEGKKPSLRIKRWVDIGGSMALLLLTAPLFLGISLWIYCKEGKPIFFSQQRVKQYGELFWIHKFRTMHSTKTADSPQVTIKEDARVTSVGKFLRRYRLDELPQLINILKGEMSFVGPRPEVPKFVACYTTEMRATLLIPVGLTSPASIVFRNEGELLRRENWEEYYKTAILPRKMKLNLRYLEEISVMRDIAIVGKTLFHLFNS